MATQLNKTIARLESRIQAKEFYEAHQQMRVISARYVKQGNYDAAADILFSGAQALLAAGQSGSAADICLLLVNVYVTANKPLSAEIKGDFGHPQISHSTTDLPSVKFSTLIRAFPPDEPARKRLLTALIAWSAKTTPYPAGDPDLHHLAGSLYIDSRTPYDAERHLTLGTRDSPALLARFEYEWYCEDDAHTAPLYAARCVLPYLLIGNLRGASTALSTFSTLLDNSETGKTLAPTSIANPAPSGEVKIYPSLPLLNFLTLLLAAISKGSPTVWRALVGQYKTKIDEEAGPWEDALQGVAEMYFGVQAPRQGNPLMDMMGSLFGGVPGGGRGMMGMGGGGGQAPGRIGGGDAPPSAELD
ncbi:MAG: hypothetical protein M1814_003545 [Vezdaea aestivalis]|nr:MAG: hypothetical protein M1814_003545 [Vezdaea aestivalis]